MNTLNEALDAIRGFVEFEHTQPSRHEVAARTLLAALDAVVDDCEWYLRVHGEDPDQSTFVDGMVRRSRRTIDIITTALAGGAE